MSQSAPRRAVNDTISAQKTTRFMWGGEGVLAVAGVAWLSAIAPTGASAIELTIRSVLGGVGGLAAAFLIILCWNMLRAPYKQRNELRKLVRNQKEPSDSEMAEIIQFLQTETLALGNKDGRRYSYPCTEVLISIADDLSVGTSTNRLEAQVIEGLHLDASMGWHFPHRDKDTAHLIGVLTQNALIDRHDEEYQRMVRDYPLGLDEILMTPLTPNIFRSKPPQHLERGTDVKYYLTPFGSAIVKRLRQQSIIHKEGSAIPDMLKSPRPPELQVSYQKHVFGNDNGVPIITVWAEYRPTGLGSMRVETIELRLVGECMRPMDWKVLEMSQDLWYTSDNKFKVPDGISPGEHDVTLVAFANGEWWGAPPFTIAFPKSTLDKAGSQT